MTESKSNKLSTLMVGALGIVYGDIGTSPLYALKSCFDLSGLAVSEANVIGIISLFIWLLILIVNIKYISIVMRCEQQGEGGVLILSSLCSKLGLPHLKKTIFILGIVAMALFMGDSVITPAISVLSALEGLELVTHVTEQAVVIASIIILTILFLSQSKGSSVIGKYFGIIMIAWFSVIGLLGAGQIIKTPGILIALNPYYAIKFLFDNGVIAWGALGCAILVITGAEALYADMGHFGKKSIKTSWMLLVLPALSLNYLGQGSLLLENPTSINNPFYLLAPEAFIYPLVFLSVIATIIASQAVISGLFSLTWQAIMLHYLPRMKVIHTSINQIGQIYVPAINYTLCILSIIAVLIFRNSESLASAYGLSVASVMLISTIFVTLLSHYQWKWHIAKTCLVFIPLTCLDLTFVATSFSKIFQGAWFTLAIASAITYIILVWVKGNEALKRFKNKDRQNLTTYLANYLEEYPTRIPGCCLFMSRSFKKAPYSLEIQLKHNKFLHEKTLFLAISTEDIPQVSNKDKYSFEEIMPNIFAIKARFGFYEEPNLYKIIAWVKSQELINKAEKISFFLSRGIATATEGGTLSGFSEKLYIFLSKNALPAYEFFKIKDKNVVELGVRYKT